MKNTGFSLSYLEEICFLRSMSAVVFRVSTSEYNCNWNITVSAKASRKCETKMKGKFKYFKETFECTHERRYKTTQENYIS